MHKNVSTSEFWVLHVSTKYELKYIHFIITYNEGTITQSGNVLNAVSQMSYFRR